MNEFVTARGGWITSLPGDVTVRLACSPISSLPDDLRRAGYDLTETNEGQRILPCAIIEKFVIGADGERKPVAAGSTRPIASTVTHAGICKVKRYAFDMP